MNWKPHRAAPNSIGRLPEPTPVRTEREIVFESVGPNSGKSITTDSSVNRKAISTPLTTSGSLAAEEGSGDCAKRRAEQSARGGERLSPVVCQLPNSIHHLKMTLAAGSGRYSASRPGLHFPSFRYSDFCR